MKEQKMKEVMRAAKELRTQKKQINKNNINRTVDKNIVDYAKDEGHAEGKVEGLAEGRVEGRAEGLLEGMRLMAANLKRQGIDVKAISTASGLSEEEINSL